MPHAGRDLRFTTEPKDSLVTGSLVDAAAQYLKVVFAAMK